MITIALLFAFIAGLGLSFLFSGMESGMHSMNKLRIVHYLVTY